MVRSADGASEITTSCVAFINSFKNPFALLTPSDKVLFIHDFKMGINPHKLQIHRKAVKDNK